jgi:hypothetical protein
MTVAGLTRGNELGDMTLSFANVTVEPASADPMPVGDHVAMTIRAQGDWTPERTWDRQRGASPPPFFTHHLEAAIVASDTVFGYIRQTGPADGSITVLFPRATH